MHHYIIHTFEVSALEKITSRLQKFEKYEINQFHDFFLINQHFLKRWMATRAQNVKFFLYRFHQDILCTGCLSYMDLWISSLLFNFFFQIKHNNVANILGPTNNNQEYDKFPSSSTNMTTIIILFYFCNNP